MPKQPYLRTKIYSIYKPSLGLIMNEPTSILNPRASIECQNVRYEDGVAKKRQGYSDYGTGTITGVPLKIYDNNGTKMMATTTNIYWMNGATWTSIASSTGCDIDNRISMNTIYNGSDDTFYAVWGSKDYYAKKWDGTTVTTLASDVSTWKPKVIVPFQYRLLMFNINVGGTNKPIRMSYCCANDISDWTSTGSASRNLVEGKGAKIMNAVPLKGWLGVYKDRSIHLVSYVGGDSIFANKLMVDGIGLMAQDAIVNLGTKHIFLGNDYNIYQWEGGGELVPIGDPIRYHLKADINRNNRTRCFATRNNEEKEVLFFVPTGSGDYATIYYTYHLESKAWTRNTIATTSTAGELRSSDDDEITMIGLSGGATEMMYTNPNEDGVAISAYFTTPDITFSPEEHLVIQKDVTRVIVEASMSTLTCQYSVDGGSWSTADTQTTTGSDYQIYSYYVSKVARRIRFRFSSTAVDATWAIRYIGMEYKDRERK